MTYPGDAELRWSEDGECWFVEVRGKNTRGGEPTLRDAWMPDDVEANVRRFSRERGRETGESWVQASTSSVRRWVKDAAAAVADEAERPDRWRAVSSHDLRRSWATYHLVERQVNVWTMMTIWSDCDAIVGHVTGARSSAVSENEPAMGNAS